MAPEIEDDIMNEKNPRPLDEDDILLLKTYGLGPYSTSIKKAEKEIKEMAQKINDLCGIKESDIGLAPPSQWDLVSDKQMMQEEQPLQVVCLRECPQPLVTPWPAIEGTMNSARGKGL